MQYTVTSTSCSITSSHASRLRHRWDVWKLSMLVAVVAWSASTFIVVESLVAFERTSSTSRIAWTKFSTRRAAYAAAIAEKSLWKRRQQPLECYDTPPSLTALFGLFQRSPSDIGSIVNGGDYEEIVNHQQHQNASSTESVDNSTTTISPTTANTKNSSASSSLNATEPIGIGGKDGLVYDVNSLKRNLLQETMRAYKKELWELLSSPSSQEEDIVDKLAALVQASPVSTTTDSNLLDGNWVMAYKSKQSSTNVLQDPRRFAKQRVGTTKEKALRQQQRKAAGLNLFRRQGTKGGIFRTVMRTYTLEDVDDARAPFIIDTTRVLGGLFLERRHYFLSGLTRTSLNLDHESTECEIGGLSVWNSTFPATSRPRVEVRVVYLDVDLCICAEKGPNNPFKVYTQNEAWTDQRQRFRRKIIFTGSAIQKVGKKLVLPLEFVRDRLFSSSSSSSSFSPSHKINDQKILMEVKASNESCVRVLKLGDTSSSSSLTGDDESWDGDTDPFVHMSADERQAKLRAMNVRQVECARRQQRARAQRERIIRWLFLRKRTFFKKPDQK